ncbi:MAG TPA: VOC family protein [Spirochaetota bacterium]|nr:VOC family protein [Spirochaetota bacterium]HPS87266.1 VOC family protein [Spirochaetota bacterium]
MNIKYVHTNLIAHDWKKLAQFYIDVFGCVPEPPERNLSGGWLDKLTSLANAHIRGIHLLMPGCGTNGPTLEIFEFDENINNDGRNINREGFGHIAFAVDDVESCFELIKKHGGSSLGEIVKGNVDGVGRLHVVYARDPEGNIIEIQKWG